MEKRSKIWIPLEGNPQLMTEYAEKLGYPTKDYKFYDVYSMDPDMWEAFIPQPVIAVIVLYQIRDKDILYPDGTYERSTLSISQQPFFIKQTIGNACGTVALLHALCNTVDKCGGVEKDSFLDTYVKQYQNATPFERADFLYEDVKIEQSHQVIASNGASQPREESDFCHFVTYVEKDGDIWQLDGRILSPINKGKLEGNHLGIGVSQIIENYLRNEFPDLKISLMALAPNEPESNENF